MEPNDNNYKRKNRRLTPYVPKNLFNEDLSNGDGKKKYNAKYQRFYRLLYNEERVLRKSLGLKYGDNVIVPEKKLKELLRKVTLLSVSCMCFYYSSFYTIIYLNL